VGSKKKKPLKKRGKKKGKKIKPTKYEKPVSLFPLDFDDALKVLIKPTKSKA